MRAPASRSGSAVHPVPRRQTILPPVFARTDPSGVRTCRAEVPRTCAPRHGPIRTAFSRERRASSGDGPEGVPFRYPPPPYATVLHSSSPRPPQRRPAVRRPCESTPCRVPAGESRHRPVDRLRGAGRSVCDQLHPGQLQSHRHPRLRHRPRHAVRQHRRGRHRAAGGHLLRVHNHADAGRRPVAGRVLERHERRARLPAEQGRRE